MPIRGRLQHREICDGRQLLEVRRLRTDLATPVIDERVADRKPIMIEHPGATDAELARTISDLREFVAAIDRRLPQVERSGEAFIARAAMLLREQALRRIADIETQMRS